MLIIDFWYSQLDSSFEQYQQYWNVLDTEEIQQAHRFSDALLHQRYVIAHGKLRYLLASYLAESPASLVIQKTAQGKPYLPYYTELAFNLSHTVNTMAVVIAKDCQIGVDIELCKPRNNLIALVKKCFSEEEISYWLQLSKTEQAREFYQFWTRKEAFVKATGLGISLGLKHCVLDVNTFQRFISVPKQCGLAQMWHSRDIELNHTLCAAVVANQPITTVNIQEI